MSWGGAVSVKWGKEKFTDVELNTDESPELFKAQLFALSGVQPDRQKVMMKGAVIKDDTWGSAKIKDGSMFLMMGTADALPQEPREKVMFLEDMTDQQLASALDMPPGLTNLGNTCYMNATLQCLRSIPELREALKKVPGGVSMGAAMMPDQSITGAIRDLYGSMDKTAEAVPPIVMLSVLHSCYPQFAEKDDHGHFSQQDANECWTELVRCLQKRVPDSSTGESQLQSSEVAASATASGFIDRYMGGEFAITMKCVEAEQEAETKSTEKFYQLSCFIEKEVKYIHSGLKSRLEEHITKNSPTLGRDAQYTKSVMRALYKSKLMLEEPPQQKIRRLPAYLAVQMVRFFYKEKEGVNAKILKDVKFPMQLDVYDLCERELQQRLLPMRTKFKEDDDMKVDMVFVPKKFVSGTVTTVEWVKVAKAKKLKGKGDTVAKETKNIRKEPYYFTEDPGSNNSGYYELQAVLTHKGRSSSSGHYVAWCKKHGDEWLMFDDDKVTPVHAEDVLKLSGGGDWHCAYVLLYGPRILEIDEDEVREYEAQKTAEENEAKTDGKKEQTKETPMDAS